MYLFLHNANKKCGKCAHLLLLCGLQHLSGPQHELVFIFDLLLEDGHSRLQLVDQTLSLVTFGVQGAVLSPQGQNLLLRPLTLLDRDTKMNSCFFWSPDHILLNKSRTSSRLASLALRSRRVESLLYFLSMSSLLAVSSSDTLVWSCWVLLWWDDSSSCRSCSFCCCRRAWVC